MVVSVKVIGADKVARGLRRLGGSGRASVPRAADNILRWAATRTSYVSKKLINLGKYHKQRQLSKSIQVIKIKNGYRVGSSVFYAGMVHDGTAPHPIPKTPKLVGRLSWIGRDGVRRFAKQVHHPGASKRMGRPTYKFLKKGSDSAMKSFRKVAGKEMTKTIRTAFR